MPLLSVAIDPRLFNAVLAGAELMPPASGAPLPDTVAKLERQAARSTDTSDAPTWSIDMSFETATAGGSVRP